MPHGDVLPEPHYAPTIPQPKAKPRVAATQPLSNRALVFTNLPTVQQQMIQHNTGHHRLTNRHGANANTGIVTALGDDLSRLTRLGNRLAWFEDRGRGFHRKAAHQILTG